MFIFSGPAEVRGIFQRVRELLHPLLIFIFVLAPWIKMNNEPMILMDVMHRHFVLFGTTFFSHDAPLLFFLVILLVLSIFFVTAIFGRMWCGWTCPQTVFIQGLFNKVEKLILGKYTQRTLLFRSSDSWRRKFAVSFLLLVFLGISWILAHSFAAYFLGADVVTKYIFEGPVNHLQSFTILMIITIGLFFNFSFFRERLCISICPYGRFQNALIDSNSLTVFYDQSRGEPRGKITAGNKTAGSCVDCHRCVAVCPVKIDIRDGFQMECISCARCIDACNDVMAKTNQKPNLIRYETGNQKPITLMRFRLFLYFGLFIFFMSLLIWSLSNRHQIELNIARSHAIPFSVRIENDRKILQNQIVIHLKNQSNQDQQIQLSLQSESEKAGYKWLSPASHIKLSAGQDLKTVAFIEIDESTFNSNAKTVEINLRSDAGILSRALEFIKADQ